MQHNRINTLIEKLTVLYREDCQTLFPYEDCWKLLRKSGERYSDLTADLNVYFMDLAGYCSWGKKIANWPDEKIKEVRKKQSQSFFEKYPQYEPLKSSITSEETPALHSQMAVYEKMRVTLQEVLFDLLTERQGQTTKLSSVAQEVQPVQSA